MLLMEEAERIAQEEHGSHKIAVISGEASYLHERRNKRSVFSRIQCKFLQGHL